MKFNNRFPIIATSLLATAVIASVLAIRNQSSTHQAEAPEPAVKIPEPIADLPGKSSKEEFIEMSSLETDEPEKLVAETTPRTESAKKLYPRIKYKKKAEAPLSSPVPPTLPPLPENPFLTEDVKVERIPIPVIQIPEQPIIPSSLDWFRFEIGPVTINQTQIDSTFTDDARSVTHPLTILLSLGSSLSETLGLEFGWAQMASSRISPKQNLPKNQLMVGLAWQPKKMVKAGHHTRFGIGVNLEDAGYVTGSVGTERITGYSKTDVYGSVNHNHQISGPWYLDIKLIMTMTPMIPSAFSSYTDSAIVVEIGPQYEINKDLRAGINLGLASKKRKAEFLNSLGVKDSADIDSQEMKMGLSLTFTF